MTIKNLVSDFGGIGDAQRVTTNITVTNGSPTLTVSSGIFVSGDNGKKIAIWNGSNYLLSTISGPPSATVATLANNFSWSASGSSSDILWGTDNTNAFTGVSGSWRAFAQTQTNLGDPPILEIPDGNFAAIFSASSGGSVNYNVLNSPTIRSISGNAANCKLMQFNNSEMRFGGDPAIVANRGLTNAGGNSARLQTASRGATSVTLVDPVTYGSRIIVGRVCLIAAYDMQGIYESFFGYPPNSFYFEWNVITAFNSGTGVITLQNALTQQYKSTYPRWGTENTLFGADQGGPATIWVAPDGYNNTLTMQNFTIDSPHNQVAAHVRYLTCTGLVMSGPGLYPTQSDIITMNNCTYTQGLEVDKMVNQATWNNCTLNRLIQQSASPNRMILNGGTIDTLETAKYTEANNVVFSGANKKIQIGVSAFGRTDRVVLNNCSGIAVIARGGATTSDLGGSSGPGSVQNASDFYIFTSGVIKFLKSDNDSAGGQGQQNLTRCFIPGTWILFDDKYLDQIVDVYEDGTFCYVQFANTTNWPFTPIGRLTVHPCPDFTVTNCTGTAPELEDWNQASPRIPIYSYSKRTYVAGATAATAQTSKPLLLGRPTTIKNTVTSAYTGASLTFKTSQFTNGQYVKPDFTTASNFGDTINMKIASATPRVNRLATTPTGAQSGDTLFDWTSIGIAWYYGTLSFPIFSVNVTNSDAPTIIVEYVMDQGIPAAAPDAVTPLRLRLHG